MLATIYGKLPSREYGVKSHIAADIRASIYQSIVAIILLKSRDRLIGCLNHNTVLKFDRRNDRNVAQTPMQYRIMGNGNTRFVRNKTLQEDG